MWVSPRGSLKGGDANLERGCCCRFSLADLSFFFVSAFVETDTMDKKNMHAVEVDSTQQNGIKKEIEIAPPAEYSAPKAKTEQLENARGWESDNLIDDLEKELEQSGWKKGFFDLEFKNPKHFTWILVAFASMGGLLSGLDQSLISGANLTLPEDLHLSDQQNSLVNSGMPLGGKSCEDVPAPWS